MVDATLDILARQGSACGNPVGLNAGRLFTIGTLAVDTTDDAGFDIAFQGDAFVTLTRPNARTSTLYTIELASGYTRPIGRAGDPDFNQTVRAIAAIAAIASNDLIRSLLSTP